jgi:uncharacterized protein YegL
MRIAPVFLLPLMAASLAAADATWRLSGIDVSSLPRVYAVLDSQSSSPAVPPLQASDFRLLEDGKASDPAIGTVRFGNTGMGLALVVAIDVSPSMQGRPLNAIRDGLQRLVGRKRNNDRITVLSFANDIRWETRWDATPETMKETFRNLHVRGDATRLYDAIAQSMDEISTEARQDANFPARASILVLSDGHDEGSRATLTQLVNRLRSSRIRLDAAGVGRQPLWLRNLQTLARAGFGGYRPAATPDDLENVLGHGIDALLDIPALEFRARKISADGKSHKLGVENLRTRWQDQMAVDAPQVSAIKNWRIWGGIAGILLIGGAIAVRRSRVQRTEPAQAPVAAVRPSPPPARPRTETVLEKTSERAAATAIPASMPFAPSPRPIAATMPSKPQRMGTVLAPGNTAGAAPAALAVSAGPYAGQRFVIASEEFWIGSAANNHLCLSADPGVSGNHACIRREERFLRLYDNGSLNDTLVNGRPIGPEVVLLRAGDRIRIGQTEFSLES